MPGARKCGTSRPRRPICLSLKQTLWLLFFAVLMRPGRLLAQDEQAKLLDLSLDELMGMEINSVYGASKYQQKISEAPASVTIITSEEIQKYGFRTLADILRSVRGFYVTYDRNYSYLGVRGYGHPGDYNSRVLVLVDGHRINDSIYDSALLGTEFPIDIDLIDRVEVIRGPNSSLYVASAFLGVINIIMKRGRDLKNVSVSGDLASYGTYQTRVGVGGKLQNGLEMLFSSSFYDSHGHDRLYFKEFDSSLTNHGIAQNVDDDSFHQFFSNLSYRNFTLHAVYGSREKGIPTASFGTVFNDPGTRTIDAQGYLDLQYERRPMGNWNFIGRIYYDQSDYNGTYVYDYSASGGSARVLNKDFGHGEARGGEVTLWRKVFRKHTLAAGAEYRDEFQLHQGNYDLQPFFQYFDDRRRSDIAAVYSQGEIRIRSGVLLNLGLRYDRYSRFGGTTNPRAALIYSPFERTTLKLLYGHAFRAPNFYELYYHGAGNEANPYLRPETVKSGEVVLEQYLGNYFQLAISGFYYPIRDLILAQTDPITGNIVYRNAGHMDIQGADLRLKRRLPWRLEGGVLYSFEVLENKAGGPLSNSPRHLGQANLSLPLVKQKLFASMNLDYVSKRRTLAGNYTGAYAIPSFTLFSHDVSRGWEVSAGLYNAFSQKYGDPGGEEHRQDVIFQDGRTFRLKMGYRF